MTNQFTANFQGLIDAVLTAPGDTDLQLRRAIEARASASGGYTGDEEVEVPVELQTYVDKVALNAYKVTDANVEDLLRAGYSEDAIFEITLSAALGAGVARLAQGLEALKGAQPQ